MSVTVFTYAKLCGLGEPSASAQPSNVQPGSSSPMRIAPAAARISMWRRRSVIVAPPPMVG